MFGSKLLDILETLNKKEWKSLDTFLRSPYFNKNQDLVRLLDLLKTAGPVFKEEAVDRYWLWSKLYPDRASEDQEIRYLMSNMLRLVEQFLGQQVYEGHHLLNRQHILEACHRRNLKKHYRHYIRQMEKQHEAFPYRDEAFYHYQYQLEGVKTEYVHRHNPRSFDSSLQSTVNSLDDYYLIVKLRLTCELINRQNIVSATYDIRLVDELMGFIQESDLKRVPAMEIFYRILNLLTSSDPLPHFQRLKVLIRENLDRLPMLSWQHIFSYAQNFCIRKIKQGEQSFSDELFVLYQEGISTGILLDQEKLSPWKFKNIVSVGLSLEKFSWVENFVNEYEHRLPVEFRLTAMAYNRANIAFHQRAYSDALKTLGQVEFSDVFYALGTRKMMLMIYFERRDEEALLSLISSFRLFLKRNKLISEGNRGAYRNFIQWVQTLNRKRGLKVTEKERMAEEIKATQPLVEERWLLQMVQVAREDI